jgi:hypothetical protein
MYALALTEGDLLTEEETARLHGQYANEADYVHGPFDEECTVFAPNGPHGLAVKLVTNCLSTPQETVEFFRTVNGEITNRGLGVPLMYRERKDGTFGHTKDVPPSLIIPGDSNFLGWSDKTPREDSCRPTAWSLARPDILEISRDFERNVHRVYREEVPYHWQEQWDFMKGVSPNFKYLNSVYNQITINKDVRFPYHYDMGDFIGGLGNLVVLDGGDDESGVIVMPQIRCSFLVRPGSILFMDVHQLHGNLPLTPGKPRLTQVLYAKERIHLCR